MGYLKIAMLHDMEMEKHTSNSSLSGTILRIWVK
jgi:hypothetical protein